MEMLYIIRGLPGSGKSTKAKEIAIQEKIKYYESDMFFINSEGEYNFNFDYIKQAHEWCKINVQSELFKGNSVIVSNTFIKFSEMVLYIEMAKEFDVRVKIIEMTGTYGNIHDVPDFILKKMKKNYERYAVI